ncbi:MAG: hypothetical protein AAB500_01560 [Patescibacteria group bacterium]
MKNNNLLAILLLAAFIIGLGSITPPPQDSSAAGISLGDLGRQMVRAGVIDRDKFLALYAGRPELREEARRLLDEDNVKIEITPENSGLMLNFFWALGLGNKNPILEMEMMDPRYGGPQNFASTGGWTLARGGAMSHYNAHEFLLLTEEEQALVDKVSRTIFRPCCGNSAHFPDCNHGMAMLAHLELLASRGIGEKEMTEKANELNALWFPGYNSSSSCSA